MLVVRGTFILLGLIFSCVQWARAELVQISISRSSKKIIYDNETGYLSLKQKNSPNLKTLSQIALPKGLSKESFSASADINSANQNLMLLRHGNYVSLIDMRTGAAVIANMGPIQENLIPWMTFDSKMRAVIFPGVVSYKPPGEDNRQLHLVSFFENGAASDITPYETVRLSRPPEKIEVLEAQLDRAGVFKRLIYSYSVRGKSGFAGLIMSGDNQIYVSGGYDYLVSETHNKNPNKNWLLKDQMVEFAKLIGIDDQRIRSTGGMRDKLFSNSQLEKLKQRGLQAEYSAVKLIRGDSRKDVLEKIKSLEKNNQELIETRKKADERAKVRNIKAKILKQKSIEQEIRQGLGEKIRGQPGAIDTFVKVARRVTGVNPRFTVMLLAGPTGTGKTTGFINFIKLLFPNAPDPVFKKDMSQMKTGEFFTTELFGSPPGYEGGAFVTKLIVWMVENPDGGGLLFDEIDKTTPEVLRVLQTFLENGEITIRPDQMEALLDLYKDVPKEKWPPLLRQRTKDGKNSNTTIVLTLTPRHIFALTTNAGSEIFHGNGNTSFNGLRLTSDQEIEAANEQFTPDKVLTALRSRGLSDDWLNRITDVVPYKVISRENLKLIYKKSLDDLRQDIFNDYQVQIIFSKKFAEDFSDQFYDPLQGARFANNNVSQWVADMITDKIVNGQVRPGDSLTLTFIPSATDNKAKVIASTSKYKFTSEVGFKSTSLSKLILERAQKNLWPSLKANIFIREDELKLLYQNLLGQLARAVKDPDSAGRPIVLVLDDTSGASKSEIGKVLAETLFLDSGALKNIPMGMITDPDTFDTLFVKPLVQSVRTNNQYLLAVVDGLPGTGATRLRQNDEISRAFLNVIEKRRLPSVSGEIKIQGPFPIEVMEPTPLPAVTIFLVTTNQTSRLIKNSERMTHNEFDQAVQESKHPDNLTNTYLKNAQDTELQMSLGEPLTLSPPNKENRLKILKRIWAKEVNVLGKDGFKIALSPEASSLIIDMVPPSLWSQKLSAKISQWITHPLFSVLYSGEGGMKSGGTFKVLALRNQENMTIEFKMKGEGTSYTLAIVHAPHMFLKTNKCIEALRL